MINRLTLEEARLAEVHEARAKQRRAEDIKSQADIEIKYWAEYADILEKGLELRKRQNSLGNHNGYKSLNAEQLRTQSTWKNLQDIMIANKGILVALDAVTTLVDAKVFTDREHARNAVYSTLNAHKKDTQWVREGVYQLKDPQSTEHAEHKRSLAKKKQAKSSVPRPHNSMSFQAGVGKVIRDANGETLEEQEIWRRAQSLGITSNAKDPVSWVHWAARNEGAERLGAHSWRWKVEHTDNIESVTRFGQGCQRCS